MVGGDHSLATKCLDICQALASQGRNFTFNLSLSPFSFSLDTRGEVVSLDSRKTNITNIKETLVMNKLNPSAKRRNQKRRRELLKQKRPWTCP